jgi:hypothetical protein
LGSFENGVSYVLSVEAYNLAISLSDQLKHAGSQSPVQLGKVFVEYDVLFLFLMISECARRFHR